MNDINKIVVKIDNQSYIDSLPTNQKAYVVLEVELDNLYCMMSNKTLLSKKERYKGNEEDKQYETKINVRYDSDSNFVEELMEDKYLIVLLQKMKENPDEFLSNHSYNNYLLSSILCLNKVFGNRYIHLKLLISWIDFCWNNTNLVYERKLLVYDFQKEYNRSLQ